VSNSNLSRLLTTKLANANHAVGDALFQKAVHSHDIGIAFADGSNRLALRLFGELGSAADDIGMRIWADSAGALEWARKSVRRVESIGRVKGGKAEGAGKRPDFQSFATDPRTCTWFFDCRELLWSSPQKVAMAFSNKACPSSTWTARADV